MRFPICSVCLTNNILCNACAEKVGKNEIKIDEIEMYRLLNKLLGDQRILKDIEIKRIVGSNTLLIVTSKNDAARLIGKEGKVVKKLVKELGKPVRVVEQPTELKDFVNDVFFTIPILGINVVYKPQGEVYRIRIPKSERTRLPISSEVFVSVSKTLFNIDTDITFE
jgi:transcription antitermination factor NusA-like protein